MTDRPDPFDDLEFDIAEEVQPEVAAPQLATPPAPAAAKAEASAASPKANGEEDAPAAQAAPAGKLVAYATLAASALAFAGTVSVVVVTVLTAKPATPPVSPERATLARIEGLLNTQQRRIAQIGASPAAPAMPGAGDLAALNAVVRANQQSIDRLPSLLSQEVSRIRVPSGSRPTIVTRTVPAGGVNLSEVIRAQQAIQRQLDALAGRMAKTTAACTAQNDGAIRYP